MAWLVDLVPVWVWILLAIAAVYAVHRIFGWKAALGAVVAVLAFLFYARGREAGRADLKDDLKDEDNERAIDIRTTAAEVREDAAAAAERVPAGVVRDSDGWRRD